MASIDSDDEKKECSQELSATIHAAPKRKEEQQGKPASNDEEYSTSSGIEGEQRQLRKETTRGCPIRIPFASHWIQDRKALDCAYGMRPTNEEST
jgi:hypothetical protein